MIDPPNLPSYTDAYRAVMRGVAARLGRPQALLVPWDDYDPIDVDAHAFAASRGRTILYPGE